MSEKPLIIGTKGLFHDPVENKVLIVKRNEKLFKDKWDLPGGRVEKSDKTPSQSFRREASEELALPVDTNLTYFSVTYPDLITLFPDVTELHHFDLTLFFFLSTDVTVETPLTLLASEVSEAVWADIEIVKQLMANKEILPVVDTQILNLLLGTRK